MEPVLDSLLVIDDDAEVRDMLALLFGRSFRVLTAANGPEGLAVAAREHPTLVLLDVAMPAMDGIQVLEAALKADASLRVIMLTSQHDIDTAKKALDLGAVAYITKPFDAGELRAQVMTGMTSQGKRVVRTDERPWRSASS